MKTKSNLLLENENLKMKIKLEKMKLLVEEFEYQPTVYHGTDSTFNEFDDSNPIFFVSSEKVAKTYGDNIITAELDLEEPIILDFDGKSTFFLNGEWVLPSEIASLIKEVSEDLVNGYSIDEELEEELLMYYESDHFSDIDGLIMDNINDVGDGVFGFDDTATNYIVFDKNKINILE